MTLYDTLSGNIRELSKDEEPIKLYQCGPTVYDSSHIGHVRPAVTYDSLVRYLRYRGYSVIHVLNFTDVDDKIIRRAQEEGRDPMELAEHYIDEYLETMDMFGIERADHYPRVSTHIEEITAVVETLIEKGHAYVVEGDVYFDVRSFEDYGKLSNRRPEELLAGARVDVDERKRHPADFALWKAAKPNEISWDSPWGQGRPGWHIECTALVLKYLGETIDIHGGGTDLIFPHHENEVAQAEAYTDHPPFARIWMHCGLLQLGGEKMSKSEGNIIDAREVAETYGAEAVRFFFLSSHYRKPLDWDVESIENARRGWERFRNSIRNIENVLEGEMGGVPDNELEKLDQAELSDYQVDLLEQVQGVETQFVEAMEDDFNTSRAIAALFELAGSANKQLEQIKGSPTESDRVLLGAAHSRLTTLGEVLGIYGLTSAGAAGELVEELLELLLDVRGKARAQEQWELADLIRDELQTLGIVLEDTSDGTRWYWS
jgi:cysteinyl-tRNA synthetase